MIVMNVGFVDQLDVFYISVIKGKVLQIVFLYFAGFLYNTIISVRNNAVVKVVPLFIEKGVVIQFFKLCIGAGIRPPRAINFSGE